MQLKRKKKGEKSDILGYLHRCSVCSAVFFWQADILPTKIFVYGRDNKNWAALKHINKNNASQGGAS